MNGLAWGHAGGQKRPFLAQVFWSEAFGHLKLNSTLFRQTILFDLNGLLFLEIGPEVIASKAENHAEDDGENEFGVRHEEMPASCSSLMAGTISRPAL